MKKLLAPVLAIAFSVVFAVIATLNFAPRATSSEADLTYFIKSIQPDQLLLVEPNLLKYVQANVEVIEPSGELQVALAEIGKTYTIDKTRPIQAERRNGRIVPNLLVYVQPKHLPVVDHTNLVAIN